MIKRGKIEVSGGFLFTAALLFYFDTENLLPWVLLSCGIHELGHYLAVRLCGGEISRFRLTAVGGELVLNRRKTLSYGRELFAILAGPGCNLAAAMVCVRCGRGEAAWVFTGLNLSLGIFNLLPVLPLDGGRALALLLSLFVRENTAEEVLRICSLLFLAALLTAGGALFFQTRQNFMLAVVAIWLTVGLIKKTAHGGRRHAP